MLACSFIGSGGGVRILFSLSFTEPGSADIVNVEVPSAIAAGISRRAAPIPSAAHAPNRRMT